MTTKNQANFNAGQQNGSKSRRLGKSPEHVRCGYPLSLPWFDQRRMHFCSLVGVAMFILAQLGCNYRAQRCNVAGLQAYQQGQYAVAVNEFQQALRANPKNADAYYNLGQTYYTMGKQISNQAYISQAEQLLRQSIALDDQHVEAHRALAGLLIETGNEKFAFDLLNTWRNRYPGSAEPSIELARLFQEYGDGGQATNYLADALRIEPQNVRALKAMGHVRESQGELQLALENYYRVLQMDTRQADVMQAVNRVQTRMAQGGNPAGGNPATQMATPWQPRTDGNTPRF